MRPRHPKYETHFMSRVGWLRAAVLGANDGIISVSSLVVGIASSPVSRESVLLTGIAALLAGALSMAAGEYVSVSSQADTEIADLAREKDELREFPKAEHEELKQIYVERGLTEELAEDVATQLMAHDALTAHARDELGITEHVQARPSQAALASAVTFTSGGVMPILIMWLSPRALVAWTVSVCAVVLLIVLGAIGAKAGGAPVGKAMIRVGFWGAFALVVTAAVGHFFGAAM